jgi:hypothetical protein
MGCAAEVIALDDVRTSQQRQALRQQLHERFAAIINLNAHLEHKGRRRTSKNGKFANIAIKTCPERPALHLVELKSLNLQGQATGYESSKTREFP